MRQLAAVASPNDDGSSVGIALGNAHERSGSRSSETASVRKYAMGGWRDSETRRRVYLDRESEEVRKRAADVRRRMRTDKGMHQPNGDEASTSPERRILDRLAQRAPTHVGAVVPSVGAYEALLGTAEPKQGEVLRRTRVVKSGRLDLNQRPPAPEAGALPGYATPRFRRARKDSAAGSIKGG
jgi:hypothetical protein